MALAEEISDAGGKAFFVQLDVTDQKQWDAAVERIRDETGALHILMNIVGSNALVMLPEVDIEAWNKMFEVNVTAALVGMQTCAPLIKDSGGGSIVNIGSVAGITGTSRLPTRRPSGHSKGSHGPPPTSTRTRGSAATSSSLGSLRSDMTQAMSSNFAVKKLQEHTMGNTVLLRRSGKADEIAYTALFLASDESSYITGTDIVVDGGWFSSAPISATNAHIHMLSLLKKDQLQEKGRGRGVLQEVPLKLAERSAAA